MTTLASPSIKAVSSGNLTSSFGYGALYGNGGSGFSTTGSGSGYGYGYGGPAQGHYMIQVDTAALMQLAGLTGPGQTGTFTITIVVHTTLSGTSDFSSTPVTFTVVNPSGGHK